MTRFALLAIAASVNSAAAFAPVAPSHQVTALNLVPEQGRQLEAFSQNYLSKKAKESASRASNITNPRRRHKSTDSASPGGMAAAAKTLVNRLFNDDDKSTARRDTSLKLSASYSEQEVNPLNQHSDDEVLYPIVGFNLVDGHAVPTPGQTAACNLHLSKRGQEEEVLGFWSGSQGRDSLWM